jgi:hypothetical protein
MIELPVSKDGSDGDWAYGCYEKAEVVTVLDTKAEEDKACGTWKRKMAQWKVFLFV